MSEAKSKEKPPLQDRIKEFMRSNLGVKIIKATIVSLLSSIALLSGLFLRAIDQNGVVILSVSLSLQAIACLLIFILFRSEFMRISGDLKEEKKDSEKEKEE
jgi:uncharacterized Tic20 family protein